MKFTVKREKLQKALQKVSSIIGSRSMLPLLGNVLIEAEENMLKLCTTDLELRLSTELEAEVTEAGITTLPARKLV
ncbi:MAG: DNA polymerase III subunit beta, partial [Lentisphaeria bacterium]|nr:DNA polymerase III subunit beta [Lentisphaeria bacterium]